MRLYSSDRDLNVNKLTGTIAAAAIGVGVIAYLARRACQRKKNTPAELASKAYEQTRDALSNTGLEAGRDYLVKSLAPEFKPALQALDNELKVVVDQGFTRAEKALKEL